MSILYQLYSFMPVLISCSAGLVYGGSFLLQHHGLIGLSSRAHHVAFFLLRIGILYMLGKYLLQMPLIPSILGSIGFLSMFWLIILQVKAKSHERA